MRSHFFALSLLGSSLLASAGSTQLWTGDVFTIPTSATTLTFKQGLGQLSLEAASVGGPTPIFFGPSPLAPEWTTLVHGSIVAIGRPNLRFLKNATLSLAYDETNLPANVGEGSLRVFRLYNHKWVLVGGSVNTINNVVSVAIIQAGTYALIATSPSVTSAQNLLVYQFGGQSTTLDDDAWGETFSSIDVSAPPSSVIRRPLGRGIEFEPQPTISPAYNAVLYSKAQPNNFREIFSANADGSHPRRVTNLGAQRFGEASIQGNGSAGVVFGLVGGQWNLYKMNLDGTAVSGLVMNCLSPLSLGPPCAVNAAGTQAAAVNGNQIILVTVASGMQVRTITVGGATSINGVTYNSAGTMLAFTADNGLFTCGVASGNPVLRDGGLHEGRPAFSLDGSRLAVPYAKGVDLYTLASNTWVTEIIPYDTVSPWNLRLAWR